MTNKTVVVAVTFNMLMEVSSDMNKKSIESWLNDSSHCLANELITLMAEEDAAEEGCCATCDRAFATYFRDATPADIETLRRPRKEHKRKND